MDINRSQSPAYTLRVRQGNFLKNPPCGICLTQCEIVRAFGGHAMQIAYTQTLILFERQNQPFRLVAVSF